jgi:aspartyl-tRNA(Asn)/glutamyl-tRNA(Gln) amidotransferase subunit B
MNFETVIGLEVHAQLLTRTKLFCSCPAEFGKGPNQNSCPVCLGLPGVLPVLNKRAVEFAIRAGLATSCRIAPKSVFARKNYFYPDLPKGYQISQYELPICQKGYLEIDLDGKKKRIGLTRIHMEEDAGKLLHEHPATRSKEASWVDLNRAGVPLLEIVSEPDIRSPQEAVAYLKTLRTILIYLDICDGNMEEGSLRCDANISLRPVGEAKFGTRAEIKNMNSFRNVERALNFEIERQTAILDEGGKVVQETRLWDADRGETFSMRGKEEAHDYRYFPDPDLLPLMVEETWVERVKKELPELPDAKRERFVGEYQLQPSEAEILTGAKGIADFFEACLKEYPQPKKVANWIINEFLRMIKADESLIPRSPLKPSHVAETYRLVDEGKVSGSVAKTVLQKVFETGRSPAEIVQKEGLTQVSDEGALEAAIDQVIAANPKEVERYRAGNDKLIGFFVGQVMKQTGGRANPAKVNELLKKKL